jgi:hypothetical protein
MKKSDDKKVAHLGIVRRAKIEREALNSIFPATVTPKRHHQRWILDQIDKQERGLPSAIDRFGKPKHPDFLSVPWVCEQLLHEAIDQQLKLFPEMVEDNDR